MKYKYVYIASPYAIGDPGRNIHANIEAADVLAQRGYIAFSPLAMTHLWHLLFPKPHAFWLEQDLGWVKRCDVVLRLPGESKGADQEEAFARANGIPVVYHIGELLKLEET